MKKVLKKVIIVIIVLAVVLALVWSCQYFHRSKPSQVKTYDTTNPHISDTTQISAHRSGGGIMPEETMMAFKNCVENTDFDIDVFEFDLHITKDDVLILLHDDYLDRTSNVEEVFGETSVKAEDKTYEELRQLNMGPSSQLTVGRLHTQT